MEFVSVLSAEQIGETARLAGRIWREHYSAILEGAQIDYMVEKFQSPAAIFRQIAGEGYSYYLVREGEESCGYFAFRQAEGAGPAQRRAGDESAGRGLFLSKLYVRRECRNKGIARAVLLFLDRLGREEGLDYLWLTVNRHNSGSIACYQKLGFSLWYEQRTDIGGGFWMDDFVMKREISDEPLSRAPACPNCPK